MKKMTEAKKRANKKWNDKNRGVIYDEMCVAFPKGMRHIVKSNAKNNNLTIGKYLAKLVIEDCKEPHT